MCVLNNEQKSDLGITEEGLRKDEDLARVRHFVALDTQMTT